LKSDSIGDHTRRDALILVDIQNDFLPGGSLEVPAGDAVIPIANRLMSCFDLIVATQDWHPAEHSSFAENHPGTSPGDVIQLRGQPQVLWPTHCVQGTTGCDLATELQAAGIHHIVLKGTDPEVDSYSGFFDNDRRHATGLERFLREKDVRRVFVMGLATDYCVKFTVLDALALGFQTHVVVDGCRGVNLEPDDVEQALQEMREAGAHLATCQEVLEQRQVGSTVVAETSHLRLVRQDGWDYVARRKGKGVVAIVAVDDERHLILVEQFRPPVDARVIELPAGIAGDLPGHEDESWSDAAARELREETGYEAQRYEQVLHAATSAGLTNESVRFLVAHHPRKVADGGGDASEDIVVHRVPLASVDRWIAAQLSRGAMIDGRVLTGLYLLGWKPAAETGEEE
jgi:nicotinamidase/pyrazinamidase